MKNNQNGKTEPGSTGGAKKEPTDTTGGAKGKDAIKKMVKNNDKNHHNRVLASLHDSLLAPL